MREIDNFALHRRGWKKHLREQSELVDDIVASDEIEIPPEKRDINMVFQSYAVWPHMTVRANVAYGLRTRRVPEQQGRVAGG